MEMDTIFCQPLAHLEDSQKVLNSLIRIMKSNQIRRELMCSDRVKPSTGTFHAKEGDDFFLII